MLQGRGDTTKQAKLVHSGELSDRVWCRKRNETGSEQKEGWESGLLLGKLLAYDFSRGTTG